MLNNNIIISHLICQSQIRLAGLPSIKKFINKSILDYSQVVLLLLVAEFLEQIRTKKPKLYIFIIGLIFVVFLHNLPAIISHYR